MNHETMLAYLMGQRRGGGSSGGGVSLPTLTNPAGADQILEGYEAVDGSGNKVTGTHVCESGGVGVAPQIDHGFGYARVEFGAVKTAPAGGSVSTPVSAFKVDNLTSSNTSSGMMYGYFYGHPEITAKVKIGLKANFEYIWNSSAVDFVFDPITEYIFIPLYHDE